MADLCEHGFDWCDIPPKNNRFVVSNEAFDRMWNSLSKEEQVECLRQDTRAFKQRHKGLFDRLAEDD